MGLSVARNLIRNETEPESCKPTTNLSKIPLSFQEECRWKSSGSRRMLLFDVHKDNQAIKSTTGFPVMVPGSPRAIQNHPEPEPWLELSQGRG